jgi:hypothetical protein
MDLGAGPLPTWILIFLPSIPPSSIHPPTFHRPCIFPRVLVLVLYSILECEATRCLRGWCPWDLPGTGRGVLRTL